MAKLYEIKEAYEVVNKEFNDFCKQHFLNNITMFRGGEVKNTSNKELYCFISDVEKYIEMEKEKRKGV